MLGEKEFVKLLTDTFEDVVKPFVRETVAKEVHKRMSMTDLEQKPGVTVINGAQTSSYARNAEEKREVDPRTGGEKGSKLARFSLIPPEFLWALAEHYGVGARKYADRNWERGYKWSLSVDALERHLTQFKLGEWTDPETGSAHLIAAAWHCVALFIFKIRGLGTNDLYTEQK